MTRCNVLVDNSVDSSESVNGVLDDGCTILDASDRRDSLSAELEDLLHDGIGVVLRHIVYDDFCAERTIHQSVRAADTSASTGYDDDLSIVSDGFRLDILLECSRLLEEGLLAGLATREQHKSFDVQCSRCR